MRTQRQFSIICSNEQSSSALLESNAPAGDVHRDAVRDLAMSLLSRGHEVEIWTVQCLGEPAAQVGVGGVLVRRFRGRQEHLVPVVRPCWWVAEWVTCATCHLMTSPAGPAAVDVTLVTFGAEAGVAGRLLAQRFGFNLIHLPDAEEPAIQFSARLEQEDKETCRWASAVLHAGPDLADRILNVSPHTRLDGTASVALASLGAERLAETSNPTVGGPWDWYEAAANKYAFVRSETII